MRAFVISPGIASPADTIKFTMYFFMVTETFYRWIVNLIFNGMHFVFNFAQVEIPLTVSYLFGCLLFRILLTGFQIMTTP